MILIAHLFFAFASLASMAAAVVLKWRAGGKKPATLVKLSTLSFVGLLATGTDLMIVYHSTILSTCLAGLFYLAALVALYALYLKLPVKE